MTFNNNMLMAGATANASGYSITNSARFVSGNSAYLTRTPGSASNQKTFTYATWVRLGNMASGNGRFILGARLSSGNQNQIYWYEGAFEFLTQTGGANVDIVTTAALYRDPSAWYHVVVRVDTTQATEANRVIFEINGAVATKTGGSTYPALNDDLYINRSIAHTIGQNNIATSFFDGYLSNVYFIDGQALTASSFGQTNTSGVWVPKAYSGTYGTNGFFLDYGNSSYLGYDVKTSGVTTKFTNSSEWTGDTGDFSSLAQNIVPNLGQTGGIRTNDTFTGDFAVQFQWQGGANPAYLSVYDTVENATFNSATADAGVNSMTNAFQMYFGAANAVDAKRGVTGTVSAGIFTAAANDWIKLQRSGSTFTCYQNGTLKYTWVATSSATMRIVVSQNSSSMDWRSFTWTAGSTTPANSFYVSGLVAGDQMTDTPTNVFAVLNPLRKGTTNALSNGNLAATGQDTGVAGTIQVSSGKWYWEVVGTNSCIAGICDQSTMPPVAGSLAGQAGYSWCYYAPDGSKNGNNANTAYGASYTSSNTIGVAFNRDAGTLEFFKDNVSQGVAFTGLTTGAYAPFVGGFAGSGFVHSVNFGQRTFTYTPPTGFVALCTTNLPAPAIKDGSAHFQTALHTGTGSALTINQSGNSTFTSDFVWTKGRSGATDHILSNVISGTGKYLKSNSTAAEVTNAQALTAFGAGSISYGTLAAANTNAATYVDWMWKGGGAGVSNSVGSITSTVSANTTAGISIVTYTGTGANATVGHGLGVAPSLIIFKNYAAVESWYVYHGALAATDRLELNSTAAKTGSAATFLNSTAPSSTVFSLGSSSAANPSGNTVVAICFAPIASFSAISAYTGNGSADGPFIYTGFKPAWVMWKNASAAATSWLIKDTSRDTYNVMTTRLFAENANADDVNTSNDLIDYVSNGFKIRSISGAQTNGSGNTIIYAAFASHPFGGSGAAPATAR